MSAKKKRYQRVAELANQGGVEAPLLSEKRKYDPTVSTQDCLDDLRRVQAESPDSFITRRAYRDAGRFSDSTWDQYFGTFLEFRKQAGLELSRGQQQLERDIAKHSALDRYRGFYESEVLPWAGKYDRQLPGSDDPEAQSGVPGEASASVRRTILVGSDFHDVECDKFVLSVFVATARRIQPDVIVLNGDVFDNYEFSRFDKDPRQCDLKMRFEFVRDMIFAPLREACPDAQIDLILGNHEHRIIKHFAERTPYMRVLLSDFMGLTFADLLGLPKYKINLVTKHDLAAYRSTDVRKQMAKNYKTYYGLFTVTHSGSLEQYGTCGTNGHTHRPSYKTGANASVGSIWWVNTGCISTIDAEYYDRLSGAAQSFLIVHVDLEKRECIPEHVVFSDNNAIVGGIMYRRGVVCHG